MKIIIRLLTCSGCFFSDLKEISLKDFAYVYVIVVYKSKKGDESIIIPVINEVMVNQYQSHSLSRIFMFDGKRLSYNLSSLYWIVDSTFI